SKKILKNFSANGAQLQSTPMCVHVTRQGICDIHSHLFFNRLVLDSRNDTFVTKRLDLFEVIKVGRKVNAKLGPEPGNGIFDSKVLSRNHAEIWYESDKVWIKDVKSSNGTFVNGVRLSEEGQQSAPYELNTGDIIEFGIDIMNDDGATSTLNILASVLNSIEVMYHKVACAVSIVESSGVTRPGVQPELDQRPGQKYAAKSIAEEIALAKETRAELEYLKSSLDIIQNGLNSGRTFHHGFIHAAAPTAGPSSAEVSAVAAAAAAESTSRIADLQSQLAARQTALAAADSSAEVLRRQLKDASDEARMWREKWEGVKDEVAKRKDEGDKELERVRAETEANMASVWDEVEKWKVGCEKAEGEIETFKKREAAAIKTAAAATAAQKEHLDSLELEVQRLKEENAVVRLELKLKSTKVDSLQTALDRATADLAAARDRRTGAADAAEEELRSLRETYRVESERLEAAMSKVAASEKRAVVAEEAAREVKGRLKAAEDMRDAAEERASIAREEANVAEERAKKAEERARKAQQLHQHSQPSAEVGGGSGAGVAVGGVGEEKESGTVRRRRAKEKEAAAREATNVNSKEETKAKNTTAVKDVEAATATVLQNAIFFVGAFGVAAIGTFVAMGLASKTG
ncbi:hypothetical protein HK101_001915, partial [Irineochytrium annulatum]